MQETIWSKFHHRIRRADQKGREHSLNFERRCHISWGYGAKHPGDDYQLNGWSGGAAQTPRALFQFTLDGRGAYFEKNKTYPVETGSGFTVLYPSAYRYSLPEGAHWSFFWLLVQHPVLVQRIRELRQTEGGVQAWPIGSRTVEAAALLFEALCLRQIRDIWTFEELLYKWLWEMERELHSRRYPAREQQEWLEETRQRVLRQLERPPSVPDLAVVYQMERTTFSRKFKDITGKSPAAFIMDVRLQEAVKQLRSGAALAEIAQNTGFTDLTHFSKAFRRHFHVTPGAYRNLIVKRH